MPENLLYQCRLDLSCTHILTCFDIYLILSIKHEYLKEDRVLVNNSPLDNFYILLLLDQNHQNCQAVLAAIAPLF